MTTTGLVRRAADSTLVLLAACGLAFALKIMASKMALDAGTEPFQLGIVGNLGAALIVSAWLAAAGERVPLGRAHLVLYGVLGVLSVAAPTVLSLFVVEHVGPAYAVSVYALSPLMTMSFAAALGFEPMTFRRLAGVLVGFAGMLALVRQELARMDLSAPAWVIAGLAVPAFAAAGNVVRSAFWPAGTSARSFSCATLLVSSAVLALLAPASADPLRWRFTDLGAASGLGACVLISALSSLLNFRLQRMAGPVVFSQIGYWGTGFGVVLAAALFGDPLTAVSVMGLAGVVGGGVLAKGGRRSPAASTAERA